ncbi:retrovirus-related Pol polyprotein from transposon 412 [Trichonephila clavipes]|nr:retrovirus-related Pol polyprotein from transposon 412 [Trichonephila clavipes]
MTGQGDEFKFQALIPSLPSSFLHMTESPLGRCIRPNFSIVADVNQWDSQTKACQLAASLRADALTFCKLCRKHSGWISTPFVNALELRFGEKCVKDYSRLQLKSRQQKVSETLQELATDVERLSHLAFSDCPTEVREVLALQHFVDGVRDPKSRKLPNGGSQGIKGGPSVCYEIRGSPASNTKGQTPHTSRQRIGHVELKCGAVRATDEKLLE